MNFILEGPDNGGKTTLARYLQRAMEPHATYFHPGSAPADHEAEVRDMGQQLDLLVGFNSLILDRCTPVSQMVYNSAIQHDDDRMGMAHEMRKFGVFVYCRPSSDKLLRVQDLTFRAEETEEQRQKIIGRQHEFVERYDKVMALIPCVSYDYDSPCCQALPEMMVKALRGDERAVGYFNRLISWR